MNKEEIKWHLTNNLLIADVEEVEKYLKEEGFMLVNSVNTFFPKAIYSDTYNYTCLYYNEKTFELKAISKICHKGHMKTISQISLDEVRNMCENHPVKRSLKEIEDQHAAQNIKEITVGKEAKTVHYEWG